jgi:hypothetical protein
MPACAPPDVWSVPPPDCEDSAEASFGEDLVRWSGGGTPVPGVAGAGLGTDAAPFSDPRAYAEEDGLPVFHIYTAASLPDDDGYRPSRLIYRGQCHVIETRYRGDTSLSFPKRSMTLDFEAGKTFDEPALAGGFTGKPKVVLVSPFNDNSYLRHRLAFTLWNRMSPDHLQVKTFSAVVYVNGRYEGLYTVVDHIDRAFIAAQGLDAGGELFKAVEQDANFSREDALGEPKQELYQGFEKKEGLPRNGDEAWRSIEALTAFVADSSPEAFLAEREAWMDTRDYEDWWIFATFACTNDSVAKNAYHFRAPGPEARWRFIPWDLDASLGQSWNTQRHDPELLDRFTGMNRLFARMLEEPAIAGPLMTRYRQMLQGPLHRDAVLGLIDEYAREISAAAHKDEARWGEAYRSFPFWSERTDFNSFEGEVDYLRSWVDTRWRMLERELR